MKKIETKLSTVFGNQNSLAPLFIRLLVGFHLLYAVHGVLFSSKAMAGVVGFFKSQGIPVASFTAPLTAWSEAICGCLFILGLFTRTAAVIMVVVFVCALAIVHLGKPYDGAFPALVMLVGALFLLLNGPGKISVDSNLRMRK